MMRNTTKAPLTVPLVLIVFGTSWLVATWLMADDFPTNRDYLHLCATLALGVVGILTMVLRGVDKGGVVLGMVSLLVGVLSGLRLTGHLTLDVEIPLLVLSIGAVLAIMQVLAIQKPRRGSASAGDPLGQPIQWAGCGVAVAGFLWFGLGAVVCFANGMMMEGRKEGIESLGLCGVFGGVALAMIGGIVALLRRGTDFDKPSDG
jgi:hypothetical protein